MVDIQTVSIAIASASIVIAVVYYILQIQHQKKVRQTDLLVQMQKAFSTKEMVEAMQKYLSTEYKDYDDFVENTAHPLVKDRSRRSSQ